MSSVKEAMYKKRTGTSEISGQLYKTKLISLVLFKLLHDERFEYFYLASNMDEIGSFDNLCFKAKIKGIDRPILVFIQAKHKDDDNSFVDFDEALSFHDSYLKVKQKFNSSGKTESENKIFDGKFEENECIFILYTNARHNQDSDLQFDSAYASTLNDLLATGKGGTHLHCTAKIIDITAEIILKQEIAPSSQLSSDCREMAKGILHKFVIYAQQSNQNKVEEVLTRQIKDYYSHSIPQNLQVRPEAIFLNYHAMVQAWWLLKNEAPYLTKQTQIYNDAMNSITHETLMSTLKNAFMMTKMQNIEYTTHALETLQTLTRQKGETNKLILAEKTIIVTDVTTLTTIKVKQYLDYKGINNYTFLDLSYTINLSTNDFCALKEELKNTDKYIVIICEKLQSGVTLYEKYLKEIVQAVEAKQKVVITNSMFVDMVLLAFSPSGKKITNNLHNDNIIYENHSLIDFTQDSQKDITKNGKIKFQGQLIDLDLLLDDTSSAFIEGPVLYKIVVNETIELGEPLSDPNYDQISHLCLDRVVEYKKCQLIPGKVCISAVDYIIGGIPSYYQEDSHRDSLLSINLLEDPNNYTRHLNGADSSEAPFNIDFHFVCCVNLKKIEDTLNLIISPNKTDGLSCRLSIKKNLIQNKIWIVKVTLSDCIKLFKKWQKDKKTDKDTLKTLISMCEAIVFHNIIREEKPEIRSTKGEVNIQTLNKLYEETSRHTDVSSLIVPQKIRKESENNANLSQNIAVASASRDKEKTSSNDALRHYINKLSLVYTHSFYSVVPNVNISEYVDESDDIVIDNGKPTKDNSTQRTIIALPCHHKQSDLDIHNFHINYNYKYRMNVKTFDDIKDDVVLLTAEAGMGKSTLLTHLYKKQKKVIANTWILKIKLLNHSGKFRQWQEDKNNTIDTLKTLQFLCQIITKNKNISFTLKETCNKVYLENCSGDAWDRFNLNIFLHYCNERKLLMLFDGFDEICPDYKDVVIKLFQVVKKFPQSNKMWITTRPYNSILPDLERHFGNSFMLIYFNKSERYQYLNKFWRKLAFFDQLSESDVEVIMLFIPKVITFLNNKLKVISYDHYNYISTETLSVLFQQLQESLKVEFRCEKLEAVSRNLATSTFDIKMSEINEFLRTPLLLYLSAMYFASKVFNLNEFEGIKELIDNPGSFSIISMYEHFIIIKLRYILFEDKCGLNIDIPFINEICEAELQQCIAIHKRLGAHAILGSPLFVRFGVYLDEFKEMTPFKLDTEAGKKEFHSLIDRIKVGKERTGLISHVTRDHMPVFIHRTFGELFAFEYVYDILKDQKIDYMIRKRLLCRVFSVTVCDDLADCGDAMLAMGRNMEHWWLAKSLVDPELINIYEDMRSELSLMEEVKKVNQFVGLRHMKNT